MLEKLDERVLLAADIGAAVGHAQPDQSWEGLYCGEQFAGGGCKLLTTGPGGVGTGLSVEEGYRFLGGTTFDAGKSMPNDTAFGSGVGEGSGEGYGSGSGSGSGSGPGYNNPPIVNDEGYAIINDLVLEVDAAHGVLANDTDTDGPSALTAVLVTSPMHGTLSLAADGSFTYDPVDSYLGGDSFYYKAFDGASLSQPKWVALIVNGIGIQFFDGISWVSVTDANTTVYIGEEIKLRSELLGMPIWWGTITQHLWTIDPKAIAWWGSQYEDANGNIDKQPPTLKKAEEFGITDKVKLASEPVFYFVDAGIRKVELAATWNNWISVLRETTFNVVNPPNLNQVVPTTMGTVLVTPNHGFLSFGLTTTPGIRFEIDPPSEGSFQWLQRVVTADYKIYGPSLGNGMGVYFKDAIDTIDATVEYGFEPLAPPAITPAVPNQGPPNAHDRPDVTTYGGTGGLHVGSSITVDKHYQMYAMWKSDKAGAIWVPWNRVDWFWKAAAQSSDGVVWTIVPSGTDFEDDPKAVATAQYPEWSCWAQDPKHKPEPLPLVPLAFDECD